MISVPITYKQKDLSKQFFGDDTFFNFGISLSCKFISLSYKFLSLIHKSHIQIIGFLS